MRDDDARTFGVTAFKAAMWGDMVKVRCSCGHFVIYDPHALWWLCHRRNWNDAFSKLQRRFYCSVCHMVQGGKVRPAAIELCRYQPTIELPMPPEKEWQQALRRAR